jgi:hypothetical protein
MACSCSNTNSMSPAYELEITASPEWMVDSDDRVFTVNLSMIRLADTGG